MALITDTPTHHQGPPDTAGPEPHKSPRALIAISVIVLLAAVGTVTYALTANSGSKPAVATNNQTSPTSPTVTPPPADDTTRSAVLTAYNNAYSALLEIASATRPAPYDPRLAQYFTGAELFQYRNSLTIMGVGLRHTVGTWDRHPQVTSVEGTTAIVMDCLFDHTRIVNNMTGATVSGPDTRTTLDKATMVLDGGTWKVSAQVQVGAGCVPAT